MSVTIFIKALTSIWPFIREVFFAGKTNKQIVLENKLAIFLAIILSFSIFTNILLLGRIYEIVLEKRKTQQIQNPPVVTEPIVPVVPPNLPAEKPNNKPNNTAPNTPQKPPPPDDGYDEIRKRLGDIYRH